MKFYIRVLLLCGSLLKVKRQNAISRTKSPRKMQYPAGGKAISVCKMKQERLADRMVGGGIVPCSAG